MKFHNVRVEQDIIEIYKMLNWKEFKGKSFFITGATGLIGSTIVLSLIYADKQQNLGLKITVLTRNIEKAKKLFDKKDVKILVGNIIKPIKTVQNFDYIVHCANNTSSKSFVETPVETIDTTVSGTKNILELARKSKSKSIIFLSSMEVYGVVDSLVPLKENDYGYIDILNPRSSYSQGKRLAECLCHSYNKEYNVPIKIARLCQIIGTNIDYKDERVFAQFAKSIIEKQDIILHTEGKTVRNYCYITDCITAILTILTKGQNGEAYNVANKETACSIEEMARMLASNYPGTKVVTAKDNIERGYNPETKVVLDTQKLEEIGWSANIGLKEMFSRLLNVFFLNKLNTIRSYSRNLNRFDKLYIALLSKIYGINNNKIVFSQYKGRGYECNVKYIAEEIIKRKLPYELVWLVDSKYKTNLPSCIKKVDYTSKKAMIELQTAKLWIDNFHKVQMLMNGLLKQKKQIFIQTWHGALGIKRIERNLPNIKLKNINLNKSWEKFAVMSSKITDYWISNSRFETNVYKEAFWDVKNIMEFGHPRNDILFKQYTKDIENKVRKSLNIASNKKVAFYAPSFREGGAFACYNIDYERITKALSDKFGGEWVFIVRFHPITRDYSKCLNDKLIDGTAYEDIQEIFIVADLMITDYSSAIYEYILTRKPGLIYATDINQYNNERGFYYPLEETPFPIATNNDELVKNIENFDIDKYKIEVEEFIKDKGCIDDGYASERVVDLIEKIMAGR